MHVDPGGNWMFIVNIVKNSCQDVFKPNYRVTF